MCHVTLDFDVPSFSRTFTGLKDEDKTIARISFEEGDYFIADWKGFFTPPEGEKHTYTGHWVRVRK